MSLGLLTRYGMPPVPTGGGGGPDGTAYYVPLTIDHTLVASDETNFPVFIDLSLMPAAFWAHVASDGGDLRATLTDGTTRLPVDLVAINTTGQTGEMHVKLGTLASASDTIIRIYYGASGLSQPAVTDTYGRNAVWTDYAVVYHGDDLVDSTGNGNTLTAYGVASVASSTAKIGKAFNLPGSVGDWLGAPDDPSQTLPSSGFTLSAWGRALGWPGTGSLAYPLAKWDLNGQRSWELSASGGVAVVGWSRNGGYNPGAVEVTTSPDNPWTSAAWGHVVAVANVPSGAPGATIYGNGAATSLHTAVNDATSVYDSTGKLSVGDCTRSGSREGRQWYGQLDELRARKSTVSSGWVATEYANQNDPSTFYSAGSETAA